MSETVIVALVGMAGAVIGAVIAGLFQRKRTNTEADRSAAEANEQIRATVMALIEPLNKRIQELEDDVKELQSENADLKDWAERLVCQVKELGGEPVSYTKRK